MITASSSIVAALRVSRNGLDVVLAHKDPALALPLCLAGEPEQTYAEWQEWGRVLALPLLVEDGAGMREAFPQLGACRITEATPVYRGEREIIARN